MSIEHYSCFIDGGARNGTLVSCMNRFAIPARTASFYYSKRRGRGKSRSGLDDSYRIGPLESATSLIDEQ